MPETSSISNRKRRGRLWLLARLNLTDAERRAVELRWRDCMAVADIAKAMTIGEAQVNALLEAFDAKRHAWYRRREKRGDTTPENWSQYQREKMKALDALSLTDEERTVAALHLVEKKPIADVSACTAMSEAVIVDVVESIESKHRVAKERKRHLERIARKGAEPLSGPVKFKKKNIKRLQVVTP